MILVHSSKAGAKTSVVDERHLDRIWGAPGTLRELVARQSPQQSNGTFMV